MLLGALFAAEVACLVLAVLLARHAGQVPGWPSSSPAHKQGGGWPGARKHNPPHSSSAPHLAGGIGSAPLGEAVGGASLSSAPKSSFMGGLFRKERAVLRAARTPLVALLALALLDEVAIECLHRWAFPGAPRPFRGLVRLAYHVESGLVLAWPAGLAAASWRVFSWRPIEWRWSGRLLLGGWLGLLGGLVLAFPVARGRTAAILHGWELLCVAAAGAAVVRGWRRPWGAPAVALAGVLVPVELTIAIIGPFARDVFRDWDTLARWPYAIGFSGLAAILLGYRLRLTPRR